MSGAIDVGYGLLGPDPNLVINARSTGAIGDGVIDDLDALQWAINEANAQPGGGVVYLPAGTYRMNMAGNAHLFVRSNVTICGAGMGKTTILIDDTLGGSDAITNRIGPTYNAASFYALTNFTMSNLTVKGMGETIHTTGTQMVQVSGTKLTFDNVEFRYSRNFGLVVVYSDEVIVRSCKVYRTNADGIAVWETANAIITDNEIINANDDAISCHSADDAAVPVRSGLIITNNTITESQGIAVLGAKSAVIAHNVCRRMMSYGIRVQSAVVDVQGQTAQFGITIANNVIQDVFLRSEPSPRNLVSFYLKVQGGIRRNGGAAAPPGEPVAGTGVVTSLYGTTTGYWYANNVESGTAPTPSARGINIVNNVLQRTLPAVSAVSDWGYGSQGLWVGNNGNGTGFYNGAITEAALNTVGMELQPAMWNSRVAGNMIATTGTSGIKFSTPSGAAVVDMDFKLVIEGNDISDYSYAGIEPPSNATTQQIIVRGNNFDGDPRFRSANRGANGTWLASAAPFGVYLQVTSGLVVEYNHFRNVAVPIQIGAVNYIDRGNVQYGEPTAVVFNVANKGVGFVHPCSDIGWTYVIEGADPTNANFGKLLQTTLLFASSIPTSGTYVRGQKVSNTNPGAGPVAAWHRITTGSGHVSGTDWLVVS
jgi:hypothetical protein